MEVTSNQVLLIVLVIVAVTMVVVESMQGYQVQKVFLPHCLMGVVMV